MRTLRHWEKFAAVGALACRTRPGEESLRYFNLASEWLARAAIYPVQSAASLEYYRQVKIAEEDVVEEQL